MERHVDGRGGFVIILNFRFRQRGTAVNAPVYRLRTFVQVNYVISQLVDKTGLTGTDRVLGAAFGLIRGALIVAAILFFLDTFTNFEQTDWWKESKLIPHFGFIIEWFFQQIQASSSFLNSTFKQ